MTDNAELRFHIDSCDANAIVGWFDRGGAVPQISIEIDGEWVCNLVPNTYRADLEQAGYGDGCRAFSFPFGDRLMTKDHIAVKVDGHVVFERHMPRVSPAIPPNAMTDAADFQFHIDSCDTIVIAGWCDRGGAVPELSIEINGEWVCNVAPNTYRADLEQAGFGDGCRAFSFFFGGRLMPKDRIAVKVDGNVVFERLMPSAPSAVPSNAPLADAQIRSKARWRAVESPAGLTWGNIMTGDSLWDLYAKFHTFAPTDRLWEIGPGYGRLLMTALKRAVPFASYVGVDLSMARAQKLTNEFGSENIKFYQGDAETWRSDQLLDVVICSSTFEHLYPDCRKGLVNIHGQMAQNGIVFIDFIHTDEGDCYFEADGTFVHSYSRDELAAIFKECGFNVVATNECILGVGAKGPVKRFVVTAKAH